MDNQIWLSTQHEFHSNACFVKSQVSKQVLLQGSLGSDGLYSFKDIKLVKPSGSSFLHNTISSLVSVSESGNKTSSYSLWHSRLGHAHSTAVKSVLDMCRIPYQNKSVLDFCNACCMGKSHRLHAFASPHVYKEPFELILSDLWGPSPFISSYGYSYYITFVDAATRYTWIYFLKHKSEAFCAFKQFYKLIETQFNSKLKVLQTNGGGEFRPFTKFLNDLGILHRFTCPHTSHQNGTVERKHRQIVETGLTLLAHASVPYKYWDHSFSTAVHLINILPTVALTDNKSPY